MTIRLATVDDAGALATLYTEFYAYNARQQPKYCAKAEETGAYPRGVAAGYSGDVIVAESGQTMVGFVHVEAAETPPYPAVVPHRYASVVDFFVTEQHRRNGIGRLLLAEAKRWAAARGLEYLELAVLENNTAAQSFYGRERFTTASRTMRLEL